MLKDKLLQKIKEADEQMDIKRSTMFRSILDGLEQTENINTEDAFITEMEKLKLENDARDCAVENL